MRNFLSFFLRRLALSKFLLEHLDRVVKALEVGRFLICRFLADGHCIVERLLIEGVVELVLLLWRHAFRGALAGESRLLADIGDDAVNGSCRFVCANRLSVSTSRRQVGQFPYRAGVLVGVAAGNLADHIAQSRRRRCLNRARCMLRCGRRLCRSNRVEQVAIRALHMLDCLRVAIHE